MPKPAPIVGEIADKIAPEVTHERTVGPNREQYTLQGPTVFARFLAHSDVEVDQIAAKNGVKTTKKRQKPGKERYERLENEPIRI